MSEANREVRELDPFGFWPHFASTLGGMGGDNNSPDPYYCFHTPYLEYQPGTVIFRMRIKGARATTGELALRVHAWRADESIEAVLVGGMRIPLEGIDGDQEYAVRIVSLPGIIYAFFARFTEPSDLIIEDLELTAEERADEDVDTFSSEGLPASAFGSVPLNSPSHLTVIAEPSLLRPCSQPCTRQQIGDTEQLEGLPREIAAIEDPQDRWRAAVAWQALVTYGVAEAGANGILLGGALLPLLAPLQGRGVLVVPADGAGTSPRHDFLCEVVRLDGQMDSQSFTQAILGGMRPLMRGGIGVFIFDAALGGISNIDATAAAGPDDVWHPSEQDIQRAALKIIGHGSDIAQITWPEERESLPGKVPFVLVVRR